MRSLLHRAPSLLRSTLALLCVAALALAVLPGCDSGDDNGDGGLGDLSVRASTNASVSAIGVTINYFRDGNISGSTQSITLSNGTGTYDLEDDVIGVQVMGVQTGQSINYTLELLNNGEVIDEASGDFSTTVEVEAGDTEFPEF